MPFKWKRPSHHHDEGRDKQDKSHKRRSLRTFFRSDKGRPAKTLDEQRAETPQQTPAAATSAPEPTQSASPVLSPSPTRKAEPENAIERENAWDATLAEEAGVDDEEPETPEEPELPEEQPLSDDNIRALFSGVPQFSLTAYQGRGKLTVDFPWDSTLAVTDVHDCPPLAHPAFSSSTLHPHLPLRVDKDNNDDGARVGYDIGIAEVPSMLSLQGNECGTVGLDHFLELPIADSLRASGDDVIGGDAGYDAETNREFFQTNPERLGLRELDLEALIERLFELGEIYSASREAGETRIFLNHQQSGELYAGLFGKFLTPPRFDSSTDDPTGLKVQIQTLVKVLTLQGIWKDFSLVEWRIRLGQMLWVSDEEDPDSPLSPEGTEIEGSVPERDVLLFQLLIACELLVRLDVVAGVSTKEVKNELNLTEEEVRSFNQLETRKTKWDLVLARRFLDNVEIKPVPRPPKQEAPAQSTFRSFFSASPAQANPERQDKPELILLPRYQNQQLSGLIHFTKAINWPDVDAFEESMSARLRSQRSLESLQTPSLYATPISTPHPPSHPRDSYFDHRPAGPSRNTSQRSIQLTPSSPGLTNDSSSDQDSSGGSPSYGGWLTRTYFTNLILAGEPLSHFLISALLENSPDAIMALGESANLYGGFLYHGRSWWSKSCIVGRILACLEGASECEGWVSVPKISTHGLPEKETWVDVVGQTIPSKHPEGKPRIRQLEDFNMDTALLGFDGDGASLPIDLTLPRDPANLPKSSIWFEGLRLKRKKEQDSHGDGDTPSFTASVTFSSSSISSELGSRSIPLRYDSYFISAFPCTPPPSPPLYLLRRNSATDVEGLQPGAHPLHSDSTYKVVPAGDVLAKGFTWPSQNGNGESKVANGSASRGASPAPADDDGESESVRLSRRLSMSPAEKMEEKKNRHVPTVLVLDARGSTPLALLARAWCAENGTDAVVGREGVTCLACCVREARIADVGVVIRVG
ncbi:hypothetical protein K402DRAFT_452440 [Aulographum hederae CBS 113979]|uniref:Uncharacterized protein n=1 Tax=Aulographum hederae CBS 113979 TaxID=1176131 RepID=A0A6G1H7N5_9PEZI|nr:hypothetical protein K402DRAFT_452440 [Aulographum hederae CBS 113979]